MKREEEEAEEEEGEEEYISPGFRLLHNSRTEQQRHVVCGQLTAVTC